MPTTRKQIHRRPTRRITKRAVDIFDHMQVLAQRCTCSSDYDKCAACKEWWRQHRKLHDELRLRPWEYPAYSNFDNDEPQVMARYRALKAASDARRQA